MAISWEPVANALEASLNESPTASIGQQLLSRLRSIGSLYDEMLPFAPADSVVVESAEHLSWNMAVLQAAGQLDRVAAEADGEPPSSAEGSDGPAAFARAKERLRKATGKGSEAAQRLVVSAQAVVLPVEPSFYVSDFHRRPPGYQFGYPFTNGSGKQLTKNFGNVESELTLVLEEAALWLPNVQP